MISENTLNRRITVGQSSDSEHRLLSSLQGRLGFRRGFDILLSSVRWCLRISSVCLIKCGLSSAPQVLRLNDVSYVARGTSTYN